MDTKFDLANLYNTLGTYEKALEFYTTVYDFRNKTMGEENEFTLITQSKLASVHFDLNNKDQAHQLRTQVHSTYQNLYGEHDLKTINALNDVALSTAALGKESDKKEALKMLKKVHTAKQKKLGPFHEETLGTFFYLINAQAKAGEHEKALKQLDATYNAIIISNDPNLGPESRWAGATLYIMGQVRKMQGKYGLALKLTQKALDIHKKAVGPNHSLTLTQVTEMGSIYLAQQNYDEALKYYKEAHSTMGVMYGLENPKTLNTLEMTGYIYQKQEKYEIAFKIYRHVYKVMSKNLGDGHPSIRPIIFALGKIAMAMGRYGEAQIYFEKDVEYKTVTLGRRHESTLAIMDNLAVVYFKLENFEEALKMSEEVYEGQRATVGEEHSYTIGALENLSACNYKLGHLDKAVKLYHQAYALRAKTMGPDHPKTTDVLDIIKSIESKLLIRKTEL